jgi:Mce-associated membrane protein
MPKATSQSAEVSGTPEDDKAEVDKSAVVTEPAETAAPPEPAAVAEPVAAEKVTEPEDGEPEPVDEPAAVDEAAAVDEPVDEAAAEEPEAEAVTAPAAEETAAVHEPETGDEPVPVVDEAGASAASAVPAARRRPSRRTLVLAGLSVLLVALWATGGWLYVHNRGNSELDAQRAQALATAQKVAADLTSIGADNAQAQIQSLTQESTGGFREQISTYAAALQAILQQAQAGSRGTVSAAGIERIDANTASALVTVSATVSNSKLPNAQPVSYRMGVQLQREGDRWLASDVNFVP